MEEIILTPFEYWLLSVYSNLIFVLKFCIVIGVIINVLFVLWWVIAGSNIDEKREINFDNTNACLLYSRKKIQQIGKKVKLKLILLLTVLLCSFYSVVPKSTKEMAEIIIYRKLYRAHQQKSKEKIQSFKKDGKKHEVIYELS